MKPADALKQTQQLAQALEDAKKRSVVVGLPTENVGGKIYGDGNTVISIGASHEFGVPQQGIPERSFLRVPFKQKRKEINTAIAAEFEAVTKGRDVAIALGRIGVICTNVSKGAFTSKGYGTWAPLDADTIARKGSSQILIDTRILGSSVSWVVR